MGIRIGGVLVALGMVGELAIPSPLWILCQAVGVLFVCFAWGDYFSEQAARSEARVLEQFVPEGLRRDEAVAAMDTNARVRTDHWLAELNWPPALAGVEETLFFHEARSAARVEIVEGRVLRVQAYPKSYLRAA